MRLTASRIRGCNAATRSAVAPRKTLKNNGVSVASSHNYAKSVARDAPINSTSM